MEKAVKTFREYFYAKLEILGKEVSMFLIGLFFLFIAIYFFFNMQTNKYFLFFVCAFGILAFLLLIPLAKQFFYLKSEICSTEVENPKELKNPNFADLIENEFCHFFLGNSFDEFKNISLKNNLITKDGNWNFNRKRDISLMLAVLVENGLIKTQNNYKTLHAVCENYFDLTFDYSEMTTVIKDVLENNIQERDIVIYNKFNSSYDIKV